MRALHLVALVLVVAGLSLLSYGLPAEGGQLYFVLVFPVFVLQGPLTAAGAFLLFFGGFLGFLSLLWAIPERLLGSAGLSPPAGEPRPRERAEPPRVEKKLGGILLLGPLPIVFGSDARITTAMVVLALALTVLLLVLFL